MTETFTRQQMLAEVERRVERAALAQYALSIPRQPSIEVDEGVIIIRLGPASITVCAETVTVFDYLSGKPAVKVKLDYESVEAALSDRKGGDAS